MKIAAVILIILIATGCSPGGSGQGSQSQGTPSRKTLSSHGNKVVRVRLGRQPVFRIKHLETANQFLADIGASESRQLNIDVPTRKGNIYIMAAPSVRSGSVTIETAEGEFQYLPNRRVKLVTQSAGMQTVEFRGNPHLMIRALFPDNYDGASPPPYDPVVLFVQDVEDLQGNSVYGGILSQKMPFRLTKGRATITVKITTSDDFVGTIGRWQQPMDK